jgi:hypothetical protein
MERNSSKSCPLCDLMERDKSKIFYNTRPRSFSSQDTGHSNFVRKVKRVVKCTEGTQCTARVRCHASCTAMSIFLVDVMQERTCFDHFSNVSVGQDVLTIMEFLSAGCLWTVHTQANRDVIISAVRREPCRISCDFARELELLQPSS